MKKKTKRILCMAMAIVAAMSLAACGGGTASTGTGSNPGSAATNTSNETYDFNIGISTSEGSVNYVLASTAAELMKEKSGGAINATVYTDSALGKDAEMIEGVKAGNIDFVVLVVSSFVNYVPEAAVFDLPNLFPNLETARAALDSDAVMSSMQEAFKKANLHLFAFADAGFREMSTSIPVHSVADFAGQKIRVMDNKNHIAYWQALGANPTPMDFSEVFIGLQQKSIDAQENPYDLIVSQKFYEVQKAVVETNHLLHNLIMVMNDEKFNSMPGDLQKIVEESLREAHEITRQTADERIDGYKKTITDAGVAIIEIDDAMRAEMLNKVSGVYDSIRDQIGSELVDTFVKAVTENSK